MGSLEHIGGNRVPQARTKNEILSTEIRGPLKTKDDLRSRAAILDNYGDFVKEAASSHLALCTPPYSQQGACSDVTESDTAQRQHTQVKGNGTSPLQMHVRRTRCLGGPEHVTI